jgi:hypothetical protein
MESAPPLTNISKLEQENIILKAKLLDVHNETLKHKKRAKKYHDVYSDLQRKYHQLQHKDRRIVAAYRNLRAYEMKQQDGTLQSMNEDETR